jgi:hypothetical protein
MPHEPSFDAAYAAVHPAGPAPMRSIVAIEMMMTSSALSDDRDAA